MSRRWRRAATTLAAVLTLAATLAAAQETGEAGWRRKIEAARAERARLVSAPGGWLSLSGFEWLKPGVVTIGSDARNRIRLREGLPAQLLMLTLSGPSVQLLSPAGGFPSGLSVDGKPAREGRLATTDGQASTIAWGQVRIMVLERGGRFALRLEDDGSERRKGFHGLNWYEPESRYIVAARWRPGAPGATVKIPTAIGTTLERPSPGVAEFELDGRKLSLTAILESPADKTLFFLLSDETGKTTTYAPARYLHTVFPDQGLEQPGELLLDFNQLENPPCAYTPYAACPLPPAANRLPVAIEAGEKRYAQ